MILWIFKTEAGCFPFNELKRRRIILAMGGGATP